MGKNLAIILIGLVLLLLAGAGYLIFQNQKLLKLRQQESPSPAATASFVPSPQPNQSPSPTPKINLSALYENIEASINSQNTAALATYMTTPTVNFIIMSSECCQPQTPDEAVTQLTYIKDGVPFDFNQNSATIQNLKTKNLQLADTFIGISQKGEQLVAFAINGQNRIEAIQVSVSWKLYN